MAMKAISLMSLKSEGRSREFSKSASSLDDGVQNVNFEHFIETSCKIFGCPLLVHVTRKILHHKPPKGAKLRHELKYWCKRKRFFHPHAEVSSSCQFDLEPEKNKLVITAVYDSVCELVEILMFKHLYVPIPRVLMQIIALKVPFTRQLTKFTITQCCIDMYTIYELNKILTLSNITDICLDHCPLKEANYDILLSDPSSLRSLSLSRCNINDAICERIALRLHHLEPAEPTLMILNLSSNLITDVGMKHFGEALRNNRHLRYLNVSDNHIGDDGAKYIFEVLTEFPLNIDEIQDKNRCYMHYLKSKEVLYHKFMLNMVNVKKSSRKVTTVKVKSTTKRPNVSHEHLSMKARSMALEIVGPFEHPFSPSVVVVKERQSYCIGNFTLCYLNIRYNNLTYQSVQRLAAVVRYQKIYRNEKLCGLLKVLLEGNYVPKEVDEYVTINKVLNGTVSSLNIKKQIK